MKNNKLWQCPKCKRIYSSKSSICKNCGTFNFDQKKEKQNEDH